ncbi:putative ribonuclease H-like domain-containing protein [Tanacetum coccineum]
MLQLPQLEDFAREVQSTKDSGKHLWLKKMKLRTQALEQKRFTNRIALMQCLVQAQTMRLKLVSMSLQINESKFCKRIRVLERDLELKDYKIENLTNELKKIKKERDGIDSKLEKFVNSSKDLDQMLESQKSGKDKKGVGFDEYRTVPPPPAQVYSSPMPDLSWTGLPEFADNTVTDYTRPTPSVDVTNDVRSELDGNNLTVCEHGRTSSNAVSKPIINFVKESGCPNVIKINNIENTRKPTAKYAELYRNITQSSNVRSNNFGPPIIKDWDSEDKSDTKSTHIESIRSTINQHRDQPRGNQRNWNNLKSQQLGKDFVMQNKVCYKYGSFEHLKVNCNKNKWVNKGKNGSRINYTQGNLTPKAILLKSGTKTIAPNRSFSTARTSLNVAQPKMKYFVKSTHSNVKRPFERKAIAKNKIWVTTVRTKNPTVGLKVPTAKPTVAAAKGNRGKAVKALARWIWKPKQISGEGSNVLWYYEPMMKITCVIGYGGGERLLAQAHKDWFTWTFFLKTKDETYRILRNFITEIENLKDLKVKIIRCDNGGKFRNKEMDDFCSRKEAARTMLADVKLPVTFWTEAVNTACYVQNRVLVSKPFNKTPYELFNGRTPSIGFLRPFGCHVMILNTLDHLGKFDAKGDEGFFVGYSLNSKAFRVYNKRTKHIEENLHINFLESKVIDKAGGPNWLFDIESLTKSMNYIPVVGAGKSSSNISSTKEDVKQVEKEKESPLRFIALPNWFQEAQMITTNDAANKSGEIIIDSPQKEQEAVHTDKDVSEQIEHEVNEEVSEAVESLFPLLVQQTFLTLKKNPKDLGSSQRFMRLEAIARGAPTVSDSPFSFQDPQFPHKVYKVVKAMYGLHQAPRARYGTLSKYLLDNGFQRDKFKMRAIGKLSFFLVLQVLQKKDGIFLSQDKYVGDILKKFGFLDLRSMIGSLMYLTALRPDIMFVVCTCARHLVTPKEWHLHAVKRIFRYLKGHLKLGLWYPKESPFDLVAYSDSDYGGASQDRKSTTKGSASGCGQVLWIQNQLLDYRTKHIEIRHHFIRDCFEKKLIYVDHIHTDDNVADLLTKAFDVGRFQYLVVSIGMLDP